MHAIRRRLTIEDGISMVEMLIAILVMTVALFALLGGIAASARSVSEQRFRSVATRVAVDHVEGLRLLGYEAVRDLYLAIEADTTADLLQDLGLDEHPETVVADGRDYTISTTLDRVDAEPGYTGPHGPDRVRVIEVRTVVSWQIRGQEKTVAYNTAIGPRNVPDELTLEVDAERILAVTAVPTRTMVSGSDDHPVGAIKVLAVLAGFEDPEAQVVRVYWTDSSAVQQSATLTTLDGGVTWSVDIPRTSIRWLFDEPEPFPETAEETAEVAELVGHLDLMVRVEGTPHEWPTTLELRPEEGVPPVFESTSVGPGTIMVNPEHRSNEDTVTLQAEVSGLDVESASVRVKYQLSDGTFWEQGLAYDEVSGLWVREIQSGTVDFKVGSQGMFVFTAIDADVGGESTTIVYQQVVYSS